MEDVDVISVGLGGHDQLRAIGRKGHLAGVWVNWVASVGMVRPRFRFDPGSGCRHPEEGDEALHAPLFGVEHVDQAVTHGNADGKGASRADYLSQAEMVTLDRKDRDAVTAGVDGIERSELCGS